MNPNFQIATANLTFHFRNYEPLVVLNLMEKLNSVPNLVAYRRTPTRFCLLYDCKRVFSKLMHLIAPEVAALGLQIHIPSKPIQKNQKLHLDYLESL